MRGHTTGAALCGMLMTGAMLTAVGCTSSPITAARIEASIAPTFTNLVHNQLTRLGLPAVGIGDIRVTARCSKLDSASAAVGSGQWVCTLSWQGPNRVSLQDSYDLSVATDGCYTATADGAEAHLGGPTLKATDGRGVRNLVYAFEGCFDTGGR